MRGGGRWCRYEHLIMPGTSFILSAMLAFANLSIPGNHLRNCVTCGARSERARNGRARRRERSRETGNPQVERVGRVGGQRTQRTQRKQAKGVAREGHASSDQIADVYMLKMDQEACAPGSRMHASVGT